MGTMDAGDVGDAGDARRGEHRRHPQIPSTPRGGGICDGVDADAVAVAPPSANQYARSRNPRTFRASLKESLGFFSHFPSPSRSKTFTATVHD